MNKAAIARGFKRFGRGLAGLSTAYALQYGADALMGLNLPPEYAPVIPIVIGPALNAVAKAVRDKLGEDTPTICNMV